MNAISKFMPSIDSDNGKSQTNKKNCSNARYWLMQLFRLWCFLRWNWKKTFFLVFLKRKSQNKKKNLHECSGNSIHVYLLAFVEYPQYQFGQWLLTCALSFNKYSLLFFSSSLSNARFGISNYFFSIYFKKFFSMKIQFQKTRRNNRLSNCSHLATQPMHPMQCECMCKSDVFWIVW